MAAFDLTTITEYLERSMQNCSLTTNRKRRSEMIDDHIPIGDKTLDINSHISIPTHLEQCLDLKTGEIYYINWNNGMRVKEDPKKFVSNNNADEFSGESYGSMFSEEDKNSYYESEESSSESPTSSKENHKEEEVLVVAGCKACFMYIMVPKNLADCPNCASHLLHFG